jgi:uncharacterized protein (TIGR03000 family)
MTRLFFRCCLLGGGMLLALAAVRGETPATPTTAKAFIEVQMPDPFGVLYVNGKKTGSRGEFIRLETPPLESGKDHAYDLRAAFRSGDKLLIQDRTVQVQAGRTITVAFDGKDAHSTALRPPSPPTYEMLPYPRPATDKDSR